jgi:hypothetical protein
MWSRNKVAFSLERREVLYEVVKRLQKETCTWEPGVLEWDTRLCMNKLSGVQREAVWEPKVWERGREARSWINKMGGCKGKKTHGNMRSKGSDPRSCTYTFVEHLQRGRKSRKLAEWSRALRKWSVCKGKTETTWSFCCKVQCHCCTEVHGIGIPLIRYSYCD